MSELPATGYEPLGTAWGLDRLEVRDVPAAPPGDRSELTKNDWQQIDREVAGALFGLARRVERRWPSVRSRPGRCSARAFPLFSFRTFERADVEGVDPVIVGVTFWAAGDEQSIRIQGDVCAEEGGDVFFDEGCDQKAHANVPSVLATALQIARRLSQQDEIVARALGLSA